MALLTLAQLCQHIRTTVWRRVSLFSLKSKEVSRKKTSVLYPSRLKSEEKSIKLCSHQIFNRNIKIPVTPRYTPPRSPVVLCHGLYGFDKIGPESVPSLQVQYWGGIEDALAKLGAQVIVTKVPSTGSIWQRAQELHSTLTAIAKGSKINFIAHSMGGLDCRYLITHIPDKSYHVQSLTTISTPHRGSPVMDWFRDNVGVGMELVDAAVNNKQGNSKLEQALQKHGLTKRQSSILSWSLSDLAKLPKPVLDPLIQKVIQLLDTAAYANLTTDYCKNEFNPNTPDHPEVDYYSYGACASFSPWSVFNLPYQWTYKKEGDNDGLVSVKSAKWGKYMKTVDADHWDLNGQR
ncbi:Alpha/Beta hydrolase protein [Sporodiniella umbellata]|nr:Alpha/Beta hydrolase protein [Sporodiniella umbellata]